MPRDVCSSLLDFWVSTSTQKCPVACTIPGISVMALSCYMKVRNADHVGLVGLGRREVG